MLVAWSMKFTSCIKKDNREAKKRLADCEHTEDVHKNRGIRKKNREPTPKPPRNEVENAVLPHFLVSEMFFMGENWGSDDVMFWDKLLSFPSIEVPEGWWSLWWWKKNFCHLHE
ncbi:MAG: hypothetical protein AB7U29_10500 [Desulfobulbus sp.]